MRNGTPSIRLWSCTLLVDCRYENVVQIRCLHEGISPEDMLDSWHEMLPHKMKEWGLDRNEVGLLVVYGAPVDQALPICSKVARARVMYSMRS